MSVQIHEAEFGLCEDCDYDPYNYFGAQEATEWLMRALGECWTEATECPTNKNSLPP